MPTMSSNSTNDTVAHYTSCEIAGMSEMQLVTACSNIDRTIAPLAYALLGHFCTMPTICKRQQVISTLCHAKVATSMQDVVNGMGNCQAADRMVQPSDL